MRIGRFLFNSVIVFAVGSVLLASGISAETTAGEDLSRQLEAAAGPGGANLGEPQDPRVTFVLIIRVFLNLIGLILVGLNVYAGFLWFTAGGNEEQVTKAKGLIKNGVIGLIIVLSAYSITIFAANLARGYTFGVGGFSSFFK